MYQEYNFGVGEMDPGVSGASVSGNGKNNQTAGRVLLGLGAGLSAAGGALAPAPAAPSLAVPLLGGAALLLGIVVAAKVVM